MTSPLHFEDYRKFIKNVLTEKNTRRKSFSMRALARMTGVSPSYLSRVMNGERHLSAPVATKFAHFLDFSPEEESHFLRLIARDQLSPEENRRLEMQRRLDTTRIPAKKRISSDAFSAIAEWYYFAILSLTNTKGFKAQPTWIAQRLGIEPAQAREAVQKLLQLGYLKIENDRYKAVDDADIETPPDVASKAVRENHRQHLNLAQLALQELPVEQREFINSAIPMKTADIPKAKKRIRAFFDRFIRDLESPQGDELFQTNIQFYLLSKPEQGKKS